MKPLTEEQRALAAEHAWVARQLAEIASARQPWNRDDIASAAMFGLVKAAGNYRQRPGGTFEVYAAGAIRKEIASFHKLANCKKRRPEGGALFIGYDWVLGQEVSRELGPLDESVFRESLSAMGGVPSEGGVDAGADVPPCSDCQNEEWYHSTNKKTKKRIKGLCVRHYHRRYLREHRKKSTSLSKETRT